MKKREKRWPGIIITLPLFTNLLTGTNQQDLVIDPKIHPDSLSLSLSLSLASESLSHTLSHTESQTILLSLPSPPPPPFSLSLSSFPTDNSDKKKD